MRVEAIYLSPVKSLALERVERARLGKGGFEGDRRFFMVDAGGKLFTQREHFPLVQVHASYDAAAERLELRFPDGSAVAGAAEGAGDALSIDFYGHRAVEGLPVPGAFSEALSSFAGRPVRLLRVTRGAAFDGVPVSICSLESVHHLARVADVARVDERRPQRLPRLSRHQARPRLQGALHRIVGNLLELRDRAPLGPHDPARRGPPHRLQFGRRPHLHLHPVRQRTRSAHRGGEPGAARRDGPALAQQSRTRRRPRRRPAAARPAASQP